MELVSQHGNSDCGLACLAMVTGKSLGDVVEVLDMGKKHEADRCYTKVKDLKKYLSLLSPNVKLTKRDCCSWDCVGQLSIVAVNHRVSDNGWHWVVFDPIQHKILDPNPKVKNQIRRPDGRTKPFKYLSIQDLPNGGS